MTNIPPVKYGKVTSAAAQVLPTMLSNLKKSYPEVKVILFEGTYVEIVEWVNNGTVDIGFVIEETTKKHFQSVSIAKDEIVLGLPKNHPLVNEKTIDIKAITNMDFIMPKAPYQSLVLENLSAHDVFPNIILEVLNCETIVNMVSQNLGISMGPELFFKSHTNIEIKKLKQKKYRQISLAFTEKTPIINAFLVCNQL
ncbi:LysR family transcriptional regulator substrate-binding protein [Bacillus sp. 3103sda1]|uniref:LysR family transcriptional regulator substrate-binding protein n=1 Tax=Bacillus sp. 3103sda1 TaxID=2953808 RepID=UPI0020A139E7|nr:LysR family transcriptional regulator substrate-binding protein [Bacillus sp. 3103sda1]MCP1123463.1 LysR family transcriptional regulator substrate-binding protein [Bacillus sp. 3103sda1]